MQRFLVGSQDTSHLKIIPVLGYSNKCVISAMTSRGGNRRGSRASRGVAVTGAVSNFYPITGRPWMRAVPLLSQYAFGSDTLAGKTAPTVYVLMSGVEAAVLTGAFLVLAARLFTTEKGIFGR